MIAGRWCWPSRSTPSSAIAAPLLELAGVCASYDALLVVDEAHGLGVAGAGGHGLVREVGLAGHDHVVVTATLSKALGAQGGVVLGSTAVVDHLVNRPGRSSTTPASRRRRPPVRSRRWSC